MFILFNLFMWPGIVFLYFLERMGCYKSTMQSDFLWAFLFSIIFWLIIAGTAIGFGTWLATHISITWT